MEVPLAVLADYSNVTKEGKLNILGIFNVIHSKRFPATHHAMQLVMRLEASRSELNEKKDLKVKLIDEDGKQLLEMSTQFVLAGQPTSDPTITSDHVLAFNNLEFEKPGDYAFHILINGEDKKFVTLKLVQAQESQS